eukprot:s177_g24.t1
MDDAESCDPELEAALALSRVDFFGADEEDLALIAALEASQADVRPPADTDLDRALEASLFASAVALESLGDEDPKEVEEALKASRQEHQKDAKKRDLIRKQEREGAALRASRVDLGPRGISQVAKIMASGDPNLGQASVLAKGKRMTAEKKVPLERRRWLLKVQDLMSQLERLEELRPGTAKRLKEAVRSIGLVEEVAGRTRWLRLRNSGWVLAGAGVCFLLLLVAAFFVYRSWSGEPGAFWDTFWCLAWRLAKLRVFCTGQKGQGVRVPTGPLVPPLVAPRCGAARRPRRFGSAGRAAVAATTALASKLGRRGKAKPMPEDQVGRVQEACAFLGDGMARLDQLEERVHGRQRNLEDEMELYFGDGVVPLQVLPNQRPAQRAWTGLVTSIACALLAAGAVDAVLCVASANEESPEKRLEPRPILARTVEEVLKCGGVKPMLSPNLLPLEELWQVRGEDIKRLLFIGVGCQVQALRSVEEDLGLDELYVLGTNCVDNPRNSEALQRFLRSASETPETAVGFEFMQDNRIHVKHADGRYEQIPVFALKVNALTDLTVGYMAAPWQGGRMTEHQQYCVVRNPKGQQMLDLLAEKLDVGQASSLVPRGWSLPRSQLLPSVLSPELDLAFGRRQRRSPPPRWLAELLSDVITALGPRGVEFAKGSIDRDLVDLLRLRVGPRRELKEILPRHAKEGKSCPFGEKQGLLVGSWTWPNEDVTWIHYVAAFYSFMPMTMIFGIMLFGLWTGGREHGKAANRLREVIAFIFQFVCLIVMFILKIIIQQPRPQGSCSISCGMPSGHTLVSVGTFVWIFMEVHYARLMDQRHKSIILAAAGLLLIPVGWSRVVFHDHSWSQVLVGAVVGSLVAVLWYAMLQHRLTTWILKLVKTWLPFMELNYPLDGLIEEAPWRPSAYGATAMTATQKPQA